MAENEHRILVDKDLRPAYYDDFRCLMGACRYNCCDDDWKIEFSKKDYLTLKHTPKSPEMEKLTRECVRRLREREHDGMYAEFHSSEAGRCAFHTPDGLCRLQLECGEKALPQVCRTFPRGGEYLPYEYLERSLSPACEGVLALLWDLPEGIEFRSDPLPKEQRRRITVLEDIPLLAGFPDVREWCIDLLQNRRFTLPQRIWLMGLGLKKLADGDADIQRWLEYATVLTESVDVSEILPSGDRKLMRYLSNCLNVLLGLQSTDRVSRSIREQLLISMKFELHIDAKNLTIPLAPYQNAQARYAERFGSRDYFMENLMVTVFFHLQMPFMISEKELWKGYVNFCNLYAFYRFLAVMSCREGAPGDRDELFRLIVFGSRALIHNSQRRMQLRDELFQNNSATLAHMAILLCG